MAEIGFTPLEAVLHGAAKITKARSLFYFTTLLAQQNSFRTTWTAGYRPFEAKLKQTVDTI